MHMIYLTSTDNERLRRILLLNPFSRERDRGLELLRNELNRASIVRDASERPTAVHLGTHFEYYDPVTGENETCTLWLPGESPEPADALPVTSTFGAAVIGCCLGEEVRWDTPVGRRRVVITRVRQPQTLVPGDSEVILDQQYA